MKLCRAPFFLGSGHRGLGEGMRGEGRRGKQKDQKYIAYLNSLVGAFPYIVVANLVKIIQNI